MSISQQAPWLEVSLKFLFLDRTSGAWGEDTDDEKGIVCIRAADFITQELRHSKENLTRRQYEARDIQIRQLQRGDLIIEKSGGGDNQPVGRVVSFDLDETAVCSNFLERLRPNKNVLHPRFGAYLLYFLWSSRVVIPFIKQTTGIQNLDTSEYFAQVVTVPSLCEQYAIADFLDRQTAKLDMLIATKQRLLKLLAEKRRALITHAVTRGLNSAAPLRDSGVEWLGEIPGHWEVVSLKILAKVRTGVAKGRALDSDQAVSVAYLRVANVQDGYIDLSDVAEIEVLPHEIPGFSLQKGDVLMNEGGDADKLGRGAVWDGSIDPCLHQNHVFAVRCFGVNPAWLSTVTDSDYAKAYFESRAKQSTNLASISATNLKELLVPMPPDKEQDNIMQYLEQACSKLDRLVYIAKATIELLHERRSALIAAAVTGELQVTASSCN